MHSKKPPRTLEEFWAWTGADIETRLGWMAKSAKMVLDWSRQRKLKKQGCLEGDAEINRSINRALGACQALASPPPTELIDLIAHQQGILDTKSRNEPRNRAKFIRAAEYVAAHPDASDREVARAASTGHSIVKDWRGKPEFKKFVELDRHLAEWRRRREGLVPRAVPEGGTVRAGEKT